jgi:hypothetical protein
MPTCLQQEQYLNPQIWGPHYWFFLHTIAMSYPVYPNAITKKKYYEFFLTLPLFIPVAEISKDFETLLTMYPVNTYLDSREKLVQWVHFIHNKINMKLEVPLITIDQFYLQYFNAYKDPYDDNGKYAKLKRYCVYTSLVIFIIWLIYYLL